MVSRTISAPAMLAPMTPPSARFAMLSSDETFCSAWAISLVISTLSPRLDLSELTTVLTLSLVSTTAVMEVTASGWFVSF